MIFSLATLASSVPLAGLVVMVAQATILLLGSFLRTAGIEGLCVLGVSWILLCEDGNRRTSPRIFYIETNAIRYWHCLLALVKTVLDDLAHFKYP
jgi:hypothetical protein